MRLKAREARILDTRKTAPGLRVIDKYAVRCGGGQNHRLDLSDGVLIKNNHIALAGGAIPALERALRNRRGTQPIEIEVRSLEELQQALEHGAEAILLDNMSVETCSKAVEICSRQSTPDSAGVRGRHQSGECARLRGDRRGFHFGRGADPVGDGGGYEFASDGGVRQSLVGWSASRSVFIPRRLVLLATND